MFIKKVNAPEVPRPRPRGRPPGRTAGGHQTRQRLFDTAVELMGERGYAATTLRDVATNARVSPGLLYRYFPSKQAVVLALYDDLSADYVAAAARMPKGRWRDRFLYALRTSLAVLKPQRRTLSALVSVLVGDAEHGLFSASSSFSRDRVQAVFRTAVVGATDGPRPQVAAALGRLLYLLHLAVLLWWLLDKSPGQRATKGLVTLIEQAMPYAVLALRFPPVLRILRTGDGLFREALFDGAVPET
jgi:AcrR family transcriptional regulator